MSAFYYPPTGGAPQLINLNQAAKYEASGWVPVSGKYVGKPKASTPKTEKVKTTKTNATTTTRKTVSRSTNKNGDTVIKVNKTIVVKNKKK